MCYLDQRLSNPVKPATRLWFNSCRGPVKSAAPANTHPAGVSLQGCLRLQDVLRCPTCQQVGCRRPFVPVAAGRRRPAEALPNICLLGFLSANRYRRGFFWSGSSPALDCAGRAPLAPGRRPTGMSPHCPPPLSSTSELINNRVFKMTSCVRF